MGVYTLTIDGVDVTAYTQRVGWSGDMDQAARTVEVNFVVPGPIPEVGDALALHYNGDLLFRGMVMFVDVAIDGVSCEAMDNGVYLANNYTYKEYEGTPQEIARKVCKEFGVSVGSLASKSGSTTVTSTGNLSAFSVIEQAYEGERFTRDSQYVLRVIDETLHIEKAGSEVVGALSVEVATSGRSNSLRNMVNRVIILDQEGKEKTGEVENSSDRSKYGTFQKTYRKEEDKSATVEAKRLLKSIERTGYTAGLGNVRCVAGKAVTVTDTRTGLSGKYVIKSDKHTFEGGLYTDMRLDFYFEDGDGNGGTQDQPTLRLGSSGDSVKTLQGLLCDKNGAGLTVDGVFGQKTQAAVRAFQRKMGLTVDGIVGPKTWERLLR